MTEKPINDKTMAGLAKSAELIRETLGEIEKHCSAKKDRRGLALASRLHHHLAEMVETHGPALGVNVVAFTGGGPKPDR